MGLQEGPQKDTHTRLEKPYGFTSTQTLTPLMEVSLCPLSFSLSVVEGTKGTPEPTGGWSVYQSLFQFLSQLFRQQQCIRKEHLCPGSQGFPNSENPTP